MATNPILEASNVVFPNEANSVDNTTAAAYAKVGDVVATAVSDHIEGNLQEDLTDATDVAVVEELTKRQSLNQPMSSDVIATILGDEGGGSKVDEDQTMRPFLEKLAKSKQAERQGAIDGTELKIRHEQILREYVARHPRLAGRFIQAAGNTLGYNPIGSELDALFGKGERNADGTPKDPRSFIEKQYDQLADELNISPTEKYTDPINWYRKVEREASYAENTNILQRQYQRTQVTQQLSDAQALEKVRAFAPGHARQILNQVQGFVNNLPTSPNGQGQGIQAGSLQAAKDAMQAGRQAFVQQIVELSGGRYNADWVQQNFGHVLGAFDYAMTQADPKKAMDDVNRYLEAQVATGLYLRFPNYKTQETIIKSIASIPSDSPLSEALRAQLSSSVWTSMATTLGAAWDGTNEGDTDHVPMPAPTVIPPPVSQRLTPENRTRVQLETIRGMRSVLGNALSSKEGTEERRVGTLGAIRAVSSAAQEYLATKDRQAPAKSVVWEWTNLAASDEFLKAVKQPGISTVDKGLMTKPIDDAMNSEVMETFRQLSVDMNKAAYNRDYQGWLIGYGRGAQSYPVGQFVSLEWKNGRATLVPAGENNTRIKETGVKPNQVNAFTVEMNKKYGEQLTNMIRAKAHIQGTDDYSMATLEAAQSLNSVFVSVGNGG